MYRYNNTRSSFFGVENYDYPFDDGFELFYSYHNANNTVVQVRPGIFDCSDNYNTAKDHLHCNMKRECIDMRDEPDDCPYTSHLCAHEALFVNVGQVLHIYRYTLS